MMSLFLSVAMILSYRNKKCVELIAISLMIPTSIFFGLAYFHDSFSGLEEKGRNFMVYFFYLIIFVI